MKMKTNQKLGRTKLRGRETNVGKTQTNVGKTQTLIKDGIFKIINLFYENRNSPLHLREISRKAGLNESSASKYLNDLLREGVFSAKKDGNLKKFSLKKESLILFFPFYDELKLLKLPSLRKNAINLYVKSLSRKPIFMLVFGSTSKGSFRKDSDLDILEVYYSKVDNAAARKLVENQKGIRVQAFQMTEKEFKRELISKKDKVISSAIETGFPVFNQKYYYEVVYG